MVAVLGGCGTAGLVGPSLTAGPVVSGSPSSSVPPSATTRPTPSPSPAPTTIVGSWLGLAWSSTVLPVDPAPADPAPSDPVFEFPHISDLVAWRNGYVGVGNVDQSRVTTDGAFTVAQPAAFFTAANGLDWTVTQRAPNPPDMPARVVPVGHGLLALGSGLDAGRTDLWWSDDGAHWTAVGGSSWRAAWPSFANIVAVAAGPGGVVVIGTLPATAPAVPRPIVAHSADGRAWERLQLPAIFDHAFFQDAASFPGGFVIVGRVDRPGASPAPGAPDWLPTSTPAAWTSVDGTTWSAATLDASPSQGAQLNRVLVGARGLAAFGVRSWKGEPARWTSVDGRTWHPAGGGSESAATAFASDGSRMIALAVTDELLGWVSSDGLAWTRLVMSGTPTRLPDQAWLEPDRLITTAWEGMNQELWIAVPN